MTRSLIRPSPTAWASMLFALLLLAGCGVQGSGRLPSNRTLEQNAPSNRDYTPAGSLPPGF